MSDTTSQPIKKKRGRKPQIKTEEELNAEPKIPKKEEENLIKTEADLVPKILVKEDENLR